MIRRLAAAGVGVAALLFLSISASAQTVDELVAKNLEAKGGLARLRTVQTVKQTSQLSMQGMQASLTIYGKRPNLLRQEMSIQGQTVVMAFDGVAPWMINPLLGATTPVVMTGVEANLIREQSSFDGLLADYKDRGTKIEFVGTEALGDRKVFHLRLTSKTGQVQQIYLDAATYLEAKLVVEDMGRMEQELLDYRDVEGIKIPFTIRTLLNGVVQSEIKVGKVEFNVKIDDALFRIPK